MIGAHKEVFMLMKMVVMIIIMINIQNSQTFVRGRNCQSVNGC